MRLVLPLVAVLGLACAAGPAPTLDAALAWSRDVSVGSVTAVAVHPGRDLLVTAEATDVGTTVRFLRLSTGEAIAEPVTAVGRVEALSLSSDGARVALGGRQIAAVHDTNGGPALWEAGCDTCTVALSPDGATVAFLNNGFSKTLRVISIADRGLVCDLSDHVRDAPLLVHGVPLGFTPGGELLAGHPQRTEVTRYDPVACAPAGKIALDWFPETFAASPDGARLAFTYLSHGWTLTDAVGGDLREGPRPIGANLEVPVVDFGPSDRLWSITEGNRVAAFSLDGRELGSLPWAGPDDDPRELPGAEPEKGRFVDQVSAFDVSDDGAWIAVARYPEGSRLRVYRLGDGR